MGYEPQIGDVITLNLPDEVTRAVLIKLVSKTAGIAELQHFTTGTKSHNYRKGDLVPCRYGKTTMGLQGWSAVSESDLAKAEKPEEVPPEEPVVREATHADIFGTAERKSKAGGTNAASPR